jgi:death on curing protein
VTAYLDLEALLRIANAVIPGDVLVRDYGLLESALARPRAAAFGAAAYPTLTGQAAALLESLVRNHALVDGNKRLGWAACRVFLYVNGLTVTATEDERFDLVIAVASGVLDVEKIGDWLVRNTREV